MDEAKEAIEKAMSYLAVEEYNILDRLSKKETLTASVVIHYGNELNKIALKMAGLEIALSHLTIKQN